MTRYPARSASSPAATGLALVGIIIGYAAYIVVIWAAAGFTLKTLWNWFIAGPGAPFHDILPHIGFWAALGFSAFVAYFTVGIAMDSMKAAETDKLSGALLARPFYIYAMLLVLGLIIHSQF